MGLLDLMKGAVKNVLGSETKKGPKQKCPNCGESLTIDMERCPKCGVHVKSMFRIKCPKCGTLNELDSKKCSKCNYRFEAELERAKKDVFICPICRYRSDVYLSSCPACGTRFV